MSPVSLVITTPVRIPLRLAVALLLLFALPALDAVTVADADASSKGNLATARAVARPAIDLVLTKRLGGVLVGGQDSSYTLTVDNLGPEDATNVVFSDPLPAGLSLRKVSSSQGSCGQGPDGVSCALGTLSVGVEVQIVLTVLTDPSFGGPEITNVATVTGDGTELDLSNNSAQVTARFSVPPALAPAPAPAPAPPPVSGSGGVLGAKIRASLTKRATTKRVRPGQSFGYRITYRNLGPGTVTRVRVCDKLPKGLAFVSASTGGRLKAGSVCWTIKRLMAERTRTFSLRVRLSADQRPGKLRNVARANGLDSVTTTGASTIVVKRARTSRRRPAGVTG